MNLINADRVPCWLNGKITVTKTQVSYVRILPLIVLEAADMCIKIFV